MARIIGFRLLNGLQFFDVAVKAVQKIAMVSVSHAQTIVKGGSEICVYGALDESTFSASPLEVSHITVVNGFYAISTSEMLLALPITVGSTTQTIRISRTGIVPVTRLHMREWAKFEEQGLIRFISIAGVEDYNTVDDYARTDYV